MVRKDSGIPPNHIILDATLSKEPLAPVMHQGDPQWLYLVDWVVFAVIAPPFQ
ncbi:MAG: hypothetical protein KatS3mg053_3643 [Candidatus Roseilinea sp.]|nr:MAG: hypothetical protein KatS3mg053_3643 [Candidatus Roseilinea sp.]